MEWHKRDYINEELKGSDVLGAPTRGLVISAFQHLYLTDLEQEKLFA